jgi:hypothetical protein
MLGTGRTNGGEDVVTQSSIRTGVWVARHDEWCAERGVVGCTHKMRSARGGMCPGKPLHFDFC